MKILFGMKLDGARWTCDEASIGNVTFGPMQMLEWLEESLGLSGVFSTGAERINQYMQKIAESNPEWCRASFEVDSWSTAKQMLSWRDELVLNGWDKQQGGTSRLDTLAKIEKSSSVLSAGIADRLNIVLGEIPSFKLKTEIILHDDLNLYPYLWREIITQLDKYGVKISQYDGESCNTPKITVVTGENEFSLSRECVRFLSAGDNLSTAIICEDNTSVLDGLLKRANLGTIGLSSRSKWRESLQILPLWMKTLWKPFNAKEFMELLLLPVSPIPKWLRGNLMFAIQKAPGKGGEEWNKALDKTVKDLIQANKTDEDIKNVKEVWCFINDKSFFAEDKTSGADIIERCDFLIKRLSRQCIFRPELKIVISQAKTLKSLVVGRTDVTSTELDRMLDDIISTGTCSENQTSEYTGFDVYRDPGMILRDYDNIIWWNCVSRRDTNAVYWTEEEIKVMNNYSRSSGRDLESLSWHNAIARAKQNMICFSPKVLGGEPTFAHPILDEYGEDDITMIKESSLISKDGLWSLLDRKVQLVPASVYEPKISNKIEAAEIKPFKLSFTEINDLLGCPLKWLLQYYIGLELPPNQSVPKDSPMFGTLAHKIVELIFKGKKQLSADEAEKLADKLFVELVPKMASELLRKGNELDYSRKRKTLVNSVGNLVNEINRRGLTVVENEMNLKGIFEGIPFNGISDMVLENSEGAKFIIDLKWSSNKDFQGHYDNDEALQLAFYSWLSDPAKNLDCAYYLFPIEKFIYEQGKNWIELIAKAKNSYKARLEEMKKGSVAKANNSPITSENSLKIDVNCDYCDFKDFCGVVEDRV